MDILSIRNKTIKFIDEMKVRNKKVLIGYRFSKNCFKPTCYNLIFVLLIKHLLNIRDDTINEEIKLLLKYQEKDGYFRDKNINSKYTNSNLGGWGWEHLTLHAIMVLSLYDVKSNFEIPIFYNIKNSEDLKRWLGEMDTELQAVEAGNRIQNFITSIQYKRDFESFVDTNSYINQIYDFLNKHQNSVNGLFGKEYDSNKDLMHGIIGAYHLWLLYFYDEKEIRNIDKIIDSLITNQNLSGGFGIYLNSSACEDIDTVDPLVRFYFQNKDKKQEVKIIKCLDRFLPSLIKNFNDDGSWVFRRNEACYLFSRNMYSDPNNGNLFYTWFRLLTLGYMSKVMGKTNKSFWNFKFNFKNVPGHQFFK